MAERADDIGGEEALAASHPSALARVAAIAIDGVLIIPTQIVTVVIAGTLILDAGEAGPGVGLGGLIGAVAVVVGACAPTIYFTVMHATRWQATVGKRLYRMAVVTATDGGAPGIGRSFARAAVFAATVYAGGVGAALVFPLLGDTTLALFALTLLFVAGLFLVPAVARPDGRCFHDLLAGTVVVHDPRR